MRLNVWPCVRPMPLPIHGKHARTSETCCQNGWRDADSVRTVYCRQVANRRDHYTSVANVKRPSYVWCCASHQVLRSFIDCVFLRQCSVWRAGPVSTARPRAASRVYEARAGCPACPAYFWSGAARRARAGAGVGGRTRPRGTWFVAGTFCVYEPYKYDRPTQIAKRPRVPSSTAEANPKPEGSSKTQGNSGFCPQ